MTIKPSSGTYYMVAHDDAAAVLRNIKSAARRAGKSTAFAKAVLTAEAEQNLIIVGVDESLKSLEAAPYA